jgi:hypothetical protein
MQGQRKKAVLANKTSNSVFNCFLYNPLSLQVHMHSKARRPPLLPQSYKQHTIFMNCFSNLQVRMQSEGKKAVHINTNVPSIPCLQPFFSNLQVRMQSEGKKAVLTNTDITTTLRRELLFNCAGAHAK